MTRTIKLGEVFAAVDKMKPPAAAPGTVYANNPLNYLLAGLIVERASGVPLSDYLEQHIFIPLVMNHTFLAGDNGISPSHATGYTRNRPRFRPSRRLGTRRGWAVKAGLVTTIDDLAKWDIEMPVLLARRLRSHDLYAGATASGTTRYGMGWVIDRRGG